MVQPRHVILSRACRIAAACLSVGARANAKLFPTYFTIRPALLAFLRADFYPDSRCVGAGGATTVAHESISGQRAGRKGPAPIPREYFQNVFLSTRCVAFAGTGGIGRIGVFCVKQYFRRGALVVVDSRGQKNSLRAL